MRLASLQPSALRDAHGLRRAGILMLVAALHLLMLLLFRQLAPSPSVPTEKASLTLVDLMPEAANDDETAAAAEQSKAEPQAEAPSPQPVPPPVPAAPASSIWSQVIPLTREELAAADIATMPHRTARTGDQSEETAAAGARRGDAEAVGTAPNGETLYAAEWYRRPTDAELGFYLPTGAAPAGWGMIACQTMPDFRVDNCQEIGQWPAGSGLGRAVQRAAWQFRVLPPRIGGRPMVGAWVRIRIDYTVNGPG